MRYWWCTKCKYYKVFFKLLVEYLLPKPQLFILRFYNILRNWLSKTTTSCLFPQQGVTSCWLINDVIFSFVSDNDGMRKGVTKQHVSYDCQSVLSLLNLWWRSVAIAKSVRSFSYLLYIMSFKQQDFLLIFLPKV